MPKAYKFREFHRCLKCDIFFGFSDYERKNTDVEYMRMNNMLHCSCRKCGFSWNEYPKDKDE